jgi:hypothetical protein
MKTMRPVELRVAPGSSTIHITADINRWFKGSSELWIGKTPCVIAPAHLPPGSQITMRVCSLLNHCPDAPLQDHMDTGCNYYGGHGMG